MSAAPTSPSPAPAADSRSAESRTARRARLRASTILLVDDEPANLDLLEALLGGEGYGEAGGGRLVRTDDARQVMALVERHAPDLVLLDLHMPHRHGLAVLEELRTATPPDDYRPVLVLTADATGEARERALALGARDFVTKPFDATEVVLRVENLLDARALHADERRARERAEAAEAEALLLADERERLLAVVAHDLRNPLGAVAMYAEMLASLQPDAEAATAVSDDTAVANDAGVAAYTRAALATIHESTAAMQRLVEDLLDASSLRAGALRIHRAPTRVGTAFAEAERMLRPLAEAAGLALVVEGEDGAAAREVPLDASRLVQLLSNLVGNAVKFTPAGGRVTVRYAVDGAVDDVVDDAALDASVTDTGPGITADDLPHLFTAFWRGDRHRRPGVGLGLWIARAIVEAHGGELRVASRPDGPDHGTTFRFTLPFADVARRHED